jgi:hypothetical protein
MEERLAMRADVRADELSEGQRRIEAMLDRFVQLNLLHTPEVPRELHLLAEQKAVDFAPPIETPQD